MCCYLGRTKKLCKCVVRRVLTGLEADPALCTVQEVILGPGVSPATNGPASQDRPPQTEEHRAGNHQTGQKGHHKNPLNYTIKEE